MFVLKSLFLIALLVVTIDANCKSTDAKWKKNKPPLVTQVSKTDAKKLKVSWDKIIENIRCVNEWNLYVWQDGTDKKKGQKINIKDKTATSMIVTVDPCVKYNFEVELQENDLFGKDKRLSKIATFASSAISKIDRIDKKAFEVTYVYDSIKKIHNLNKALIRFNKSVISNPSCIKSVEIVGVEIPRPPSKRSKIRNRHSGSHSFNHNSRHSNSGHSIYPGLNSGASYGSYSGSGNSFGGHGTGSHSSTSSIRSSYSDIARKPGSRSSSLGSQDSWFKETTTLKPYRSRYRRSLFKKKTKNASIFKSNSISKSILGKGSAFPPFNGKVIEVIAEIKPCKAYKFNLKIISPSGSTITEVKDLSLPVLQDMDNYRPPPLAKIFQIQKQSGNNPPLIKVDQSYGVPNECLKDFFETVDNIFYDMEADIQYHMQQESNAYNQRSRANSQLNNIKSRQLKDKFACVCNSTRILLNTTEAKVYKRYKDAFGYYDFAGEQNNRPYYTKIYSVHPTKSKTTTKPKSVKPTYYLYWSMEEETWVVGPQMNNEDLVLKVKKKKNNVAKCPADPKTQKMWRYDGTLKWHDSNLIKATCDMKH